MCCTGCAEQGVGRAEQRHAAQGKVYCTRAGRAVHGTGCAGQGAGVLHKGQGVLHRGQGGLYKGQSVLHRGWAEYAAQGSQGVECAVQEVLCASQR